MTITIQQFENDPMVSRKEFETQTKANIKKKYIQREIERVRKTCKQFEYPNNICNAAFRRMDDQKIVTIFSCSLFYCWVREH